MPLLIPHLPHHLLQCYHAPNTSLMRGSNVACCSFAHVRPPASLIPFPGHGTRRVAPAFDDSAALS
eukprot:4795033-Ditylum_brightwellii.AAC.1